MPGMFYAEIYVKTEQLHKNPSSLYKGLFKKNLQVLSHQMIWIAWTVLKRDTARIVGHYNDLDKSFKLKAVKLP